MARKRGFENTVSIVIAVTLENFLMHLRYLPKKGAIVEVNKSKMLLFPKKGGIDRDLFLHKKREILCTDHLIGDGIVKEGDVILDIGANIGYYVLIESQLVGANGKVYAVEPVRGNVEVLKKNVRLNNLKNVSTFQLAFGECDEESTIYVSNLANLCSMNKNFTGGKIMGTQSISKETVDTFLKNRPQPSLVRMDVEGYEYEIFIGMLQLLRGDLSILVELHPQFLSEKLNEIFQILKQNNFCVRFAVFEAKVKENKIVNALLQKGGVSLPTFVVTNVSLQELQNLMKDHPNLSPNVLFEKQSCQQQTSGETVAVQVEEVG
jgi:FkbM family methyltransferase